MILCAYITSGPARNKLSDPTGPLDRLRRNLEDLHAIATSNGGNRAFGLPGYKASVDYVLERLQQPGFETLTSWVQPFNHTFNEVRSISVTGPDGEDEEVVALIYNPGTPLPDGITAPLIDTPVDDERGAYLSVADLFPCVILVFRRL